MVEVNFANLREMLARGAVEFIDELPRNIIGKTLKKDLKKQPHGEGRH
jgi:acyl-coenzyme A synthetase/AMP-(fatty) acid ligase